MKAINSDDRVRLELVKQKILRMFRVLHKNGIGLDESHILLLTLSLCKDGLISREFLLGHRYTNREKSVYLEEIPGEVSESYSKIIPVLANSLFRIQSNELWEHLLELDRVTLKEYFSEIFEFTLKHISRHHRYKGETMQPVEITRFICGIANLSKNSRVFNPFAGHASFGVFFDENHKYYGQEIDKKTWAIGFLRLMAHRKASSSSFSCDDSVLNWPVEKKFDLIVASPPLGMRFKSKYGLTDSGPRFVEQFLIERSVDTLSDKGQLIALLPQSFLYRRRDQDSFRRQILDKDLLDTVVSFPGGILSNTGMPMVVLVIKKQKKLPNQVRFIDAAKFIREMNSRHKILDDKGLVSMVLSSFEDSDSVRVVDDKVIKENDYIFHVPRYFKKEIPLAEGERLVKLKDLLKKEVGDRLTLPKYGKFIRIRDLKSDIVDFNLDLSKVENEEVPRPLVHELKTTCLLLAIRWGELKPTLFVYQGESVYRNRDIVSYTVDESKVDYAYLINELHTDYVKAQTEVYRMGSTIPFLRQEDLLEVSIKLPSLVEQRAKAQGILELSHRIKALREERNALAQGVTSKLYENASTIKHSLGKPLLNIGASLRNIENALSSQDFNWEKVKLSDRFDLTIKDSFDSVHSNLELINSILLKNESVFDVSNYSLYPLHFIPFIENYVKHVVPVELRNVSINLDIHPDLKEDKIQITGNKELLEIGFNTIVENAVRHGFVDALENYRLEFRVSYHVTKAMLNDTNDNLERFDSYLKIEVANNGKELPANFNLEKLVRKNSFAGNTGNTGQGGFDLNEIIKVHNNGVSTLQLIRESIPSEFTTTYSFLIPLNR